MTVLQVQSLPVLAHQHRQNIFFGGFFGSTAWCGLHWVEKVSFCSLRWY
jgi:hypothetical protein